MLTFLKGASLPKEEGNICYSSGCVEPLPGGVLVPMIP